MSQIKSYHIHQFNEKILTTTSSYNLHCIISPRIHHQKTLQNYQQQSSKFINEFIISKKSNYIPNNQNYYENHFNINNINQVTNNFTITNNNHLNNHFNSIKLPQRLVNSMHSNNSNNTNNFNNSNDSNNQSINMKSTQNSISPQNHNKFYQFKKIREEKCRQKNQGKVIKSFKVSLEKPSQYGQISSEYGKKQLQQSNIVQEKTAENKIEQSTLKDRKKFIQCLDDIQTIVSKNSPRESLSSQVVPKIEQSQIIMKGTDLYQSLLEDAEEQMRKRKQQELNVDKYKMNMYAINLVSIHNQNHDRNSLYLPSKVTDKQKILQLFSQKYQKVNDIFYHTLLMKKQLEESNIIIINQQQQTIKTKRIE